MTNKKDRQLHYSVGVVVVLIAILYLLSLHLSSGKKEEANDQKVELTPIVAENFEGEADPAHMFLGMKTWNWIKAKSSDGTVVTPKGDKPFTLTFDFKTSNFSITTDCNNGTGIFAAQSGVVQFGNVASTKMACEGSQESVFTGYLSSAQKFYFTSKGEMVIATKDGTNVVFR